MNYTPPSDKEPIKHKHKFYDRPEILAVGCECGVVRFGTRYGAAEYNPKTNKTVRLSDEKVLYEG